MWKTSKGKTWCLESCLKSSDTPSGSVPTASIQCDRLKSPMLVGRELSMIEVGHGHPLIPVQSSFLAV
jgi:hypothetical protein